MNPIEERQLIELYIEGHSSEPIGRLFKEYYKEIVMYCYRYVQSTEVAEDITMNLFTKLLNFDKNEREKLKNLSNARYYFIVLAKNSCIDYLRKVKRQQNILEGLKNSSFFSTSINQTESFIANDAKEKLFDILSPREKQLISLSLLYSNGEIAEQLGISKTTVSNIIYNAKQKLRSAWNSLICLIFFFLIS